MTTSIRRLSNSPVERRQQPMTDLSQLESLYLSHHLARSSSPKTIYHYQSTFDTFRLFLESSRRPATSEALISAVIAQFAIWLKDTPSKKWRGGTTRSIVTIHGHLKDLRAFTRWLHDEGMLEERPKIYLPKLPRTLFPILSEDDLAKVFSCRQLSPDTEIGKRNRALIAFMLDTAVRLSEVSRLCLEDVSIHDGAAKILGKGSRERLVFFSPSTEEAINLWLSVRGKDSGSLFWLSSAGVRMLIDRIQKETGLEVFHAHQIRHTALTMLVRGKVDIHTVKRIAGHSSLSVTELYLSLSNDDLKEAHRTASPVEKIVSTLEPHRPKRKRWSNRA